MKLNQLDETIEAKILPKEEESTHRIRVLEEKMEEAQEEIERAQFQAKKALEELQSTQEKNNHIFSHISFRFWMGAFKERLDHLMKHKEGVEKMEWEFKDNYGAKWEGEYEGEVEGGKPNGIGRWKRDGGNYIVEGEWKEGLLHGRAVQNYSDGDHREYEVKDGKLNGKHICYYADGDYD